MLRISQLVLPVEHTSEQLKKKLLRTVRIKEEELKGFSVRKRSLDCRKKPEIYYVYTIDLDVYQEERVLRKMKGKITRVMEKPYQIPGCGETKLHARPVIAGSGPSGIFCAYLLAQAGYRPLIIERGASVRERQKDVECYWEKGVLNPSSNVQFGEGGAGTFSDGKLNTLVKDSFGRNRYVLEMFVKFGAPREILWEQKPHIGTDILIRIVEEMRFAIERMGGEFRFHSQMTDLIQEERMIEINGAQRQKAGVIVLALGHSARDTFHMLWERGIPMEQKAFAIGVRVEHPQKWIDEAMYGKGAKRFLPPASYKLSEQLENGRGVYTFCMCPGGYVVNASSEEGMLAVNGMSYHDRGGTNANSAVIVTVSGKDYGSDHPLAGIEFQRKLERSAWEIGVGKVPIQRFEDFCLNRKSSKLGKMTPSIKGEWVLGNVRSIFPSDLADCIEQGIKKMGHKIDRFDDGDCILSGVESRTSSPVRIIRQGDFSSGNGWIYPCGEGAGYAGGITSAAMDGMKTAEAIIRKYAPFQEDDKTGGI